MASSHIVEKHSKQLKIDEDVDPAHWTGKSRLDNLADFILVQVDKEGCG